MKDAGGMSLKFSHADEAGIFPDGELILREAMRRQQLLVMRVPDNGAYLRFGIDCVHTGARRCVPESQETVSCATTGCQQVCLPRAPRKRLDSGCVRSESVFRSNNSGSITIGSCRLLKLLRLMIPYAHGIVIRSGRKLCSGSIPLESTHFLSVTHKRSDMMSRHAHVMVMDRPITRP